MRAFTLILMAATVFGVAAHAQVQQEPTRTPAAKIPPLRPGIMYVLRFDRPAASVTVANPAVADVDVRPFPDRRGALVIGKISGETSLVAFDVNGNKVAFDVNGNKVDEAIVTVTAGLQPPPPPGRVDVHPKGRVVHYYWPYTCNDTGCWRRDDPFAGPLPGTQLSESRTTFEGLEGGAAPSVPIAPSPVQGQ
jgi:hypothetical protein